MSVIYIWFIIYFLRPGSNTAAHTEYGRDTLVLLTVSDGWQGGRNEGSVRVAGSWGTSRIVKIEHK